MPILNESGPRTRKERVFDEETPPPVPSRANSIAKKEREHKEKLEKAKAEQQRAAEVERLRMEAEKLSSSQQYSTFEFEEDITGFGEDEDIDEDFVVHRIPEPESVAKLRALSMKENGEDCFDV